MTLPIESPVEKVGDYLHVFAGNILFTRSDTSKDALTNKTPQLSLGFENRRDMDGNVDWSAFFNALDEINYTGFCSVEFESFSYLENVLGGDIEAAARLSMKQIDSLLARNR